MVGYKIISWPEVQDFMEYEDFYDNSTLIMPNSNIGIEDSTYLISKEWLSKHE